MMKNCEKLEKNPREVFKSIESEVQRDSSIENIDGKAILFYCDSPSTRLGWGRNNNFNHETNRARR